MTRINARLATLKIWSPHRYSKATHTHTNLYSASTQLSLHNIFDHAHYPKWLNYYREDECRVVCGPFGMITSWANVTNCRMGADVGHWETPQTKGCQNLTYRLQLLRLEQLPLCSCGSVVEHCVSSAKGCGFNSLGTHILTKKHV